LAEVAMDVQANEAHRTPPPLSVVPGRRRGGRRDNYGSVRTAHPDSRRGGHLQTAGSQPIMCDGLPNLRLPEAPGIRNAPTLRQRPDDPETPPAQFHLPTTDIARIDRSDSSHQMRNRRQPPNRQPDRA